MVNIGRPRKGCSTCGKRKVKCDETKPACVQCAKSGWECPGYPADVDLIFRNQLSQHPKEHSADANLRCKSSRETVLTRTKCPSPLSPPLEDRAISFFVYHYVLETDRRVPQLGFVDRLPGLLSTDTIGLLRAVMIASGLAALSNAGNSKSWQITAYQHYGKALKLLRDSLNDAHLAVLEHTLASILFLGTFEAIAIADTQAMTSFSRHVIAAAHCIDLRGPAQFHDPMSIGLFLELRRLIVMTVHQLQEPMPCHLAKWSLWLPSSHSMDKLPVNAFAEINARLASVRFRIKSEKIYASCEIAALLLPIDRELEQWAISLPASWIYQSHSSASDPGLSDNDVYPNIWVASMWNNYRSVRIMIHQHILSATPCCRSDEEEIARKNAACVLREMTAGVCRSVKYYLGDLDENGAKGVFSGMPACYQLIWPLFLSGMLRITPMPTKSWVSGKLREIGKAMGLQLAISMSEKVSMSETSFSDREAWIIGEWYPISNLQSSATQPDIQTR